jgi:hypothetical protein
MNDFLYQYQNCILDFYLNQNQSVCELCINKCKESEYYNDNLQPIDYVVLHELCDKCHININDFYMKSKFHIKMEYGALYEYYDYKEYEENSIILDKNIIHTNKDIQDKIIFSKASRFNLDYLEFTLYNE